MKPSRPLLSALACMAAAPAWAQLADQPVAPPLAITSAIPSSLDGASDPTFSFAGVPGYGSLSVSFGPFFEGQSATDPSMPPTSVTGSPTGPLALTADAPQNAPGPPWQAVVETDVNNSSLEVVGGAPDYVSDGMGGYFQVTNGFGGPIALLFSQPVTGVQLTLGDFDQAGSTAIEGFTASGASLGQVSNVDVGFETFDLADAGGQPISGLLISGSDPAGFEVSGFGVFQSVATQIPAPAGLAAAPALAGLALLRRRPG